MQKLNRNELLLIADLLELGSVSLSENKSGLEDIPERCFKNWTQEEKNLLERDCAELDENLKEIVEDIEDEPNHKFLFSDGTLMLFFSRKIKNFYE